MFDGIQRPEGQTQKPKSAAWAQPVDRVYSASNPNANPEAIHPVKPASGKRSFLPVLLVTLLLAVLGGGGYWYYTNYYNVDEPVIAENNMMEEEQVIEEDEEVGLVFPDDYFLTDDEVGFDIADNLSPSQIEEGVNIEETLYEGADLSGVSESWAQSYMLSYVSVIVLSFNNNEALDIEIQKILNKRKSESDYWLGDVYASYIVHDNNLIIISSSRGNSDDYKAFVEAYEKKLNSKVIATILGEEAEMGANTPPVQLSLENLAIEGDVFEAEYDSYLGFCESSSTVDLRNNLDQVSEFNCFDNEFGWSASVKIDNLYRCVDFTQLQLETKEPAKSISCLDLDFITGGVDFYSEEALFCYAMKHPTVINYYPELDLKVNHQLMIDEYNKLTDEEKDNVFNEKCTIAQDSDLIDLMLMMDKDIDGLRLYFEKFFGASDNNKDTDGDGYDDYTEIKNGYSPITNESEVEIFIGNNGVEYVDYINEDFNYSIWRPKDWYIVNESLITEGDVNICPTIDCQSNFSISVYSGKESLEGNSLEDVKNDLINKGYEEYELEDILAYISKSKDEVALIKLPLENDEIEVHLITFKNVDSGLVANEYIIFEEMLQSFKFMEN